MSEPVQITAIVFDLWETLATKNIGVSKTIQAKFGIPQSPNFLVDYEKSVQLKAWGTEGDMAAKFLTDFGIENSLENNQFVQQVFRTGIERATLFDGIPELLGELKNAGLKLGLLSNTTVFEAVVLDKLNISRFFDVMTFSWQTGVLKPDKLAFKSVLDKLGSLAEETLFVDDTERHVVAARKYGLQAVQFQSVMSIQAELEKYY